MDDKESEMTDGVDPPVDPPPISIELSELVSLWGEKVNPKTLGTEVLHYSIPSWTTNKPELVHASVIQSTKYLLPPEAILVSRLNPSTHKVWRLKKNGFEGVRLGSTEWAVVVPNEIDRLPYIHCCLEQQSFRFQMLSYVTGTTNSHQRVKATDFLKLEIPLLGRRTETILGNIHCDVADYNETITKQEDLVNSLISTMFRSWFIDFEPVKSKAEGRLPYGMNEEIAALFPDSFEDSRLGAIPVGWEETNLRDIRFIKGKIPEKSTTLHESTQVIDMDLIMFGIHKTASSENAVMACERDVLMLMDGENSGFIVRTPTNGAVGSTFAIIEHDELDRHYLLELLLQNEYWIRRNTTGTGIPHVDKEIVRHIEFALPPKEIREEFFMAVEVLLAATTQSRDTASYLSNVRDSVIPQFMSSSS